MVKIYDWCNNKINNTNRIPTASGLPNSRIISITESSHPSCVSLLLVPYSTRCDDSPGTHQLALSLHSQLPSLLFSIPNSPPSSFFILQTQTISPVHSPVLRTAPSPVHSLRRPSIRTGTPSSTQCPNGTYFLPAHSIHCLKTKIIQMRILFICSCKIIIVISS